MGFDLSTAKEVSGGGGFDLSTAKELGSDNPPELINNNPPEQPQPQPQPQPPGYFNFSDPLGLSALEPALEMGSGLVGAAAGGLTGLGTLAIGGGLEKAAHNTQAVQNVLTYEPRTPQGKEASELVNWPMKKATEGWGMIGEGVGNQISPNAGAAGKAIGEAGFQTLATLAGGKEAFKSARHLPNDPAILNKMLEQAVDRGFNKGVKPSGTVKTRAALIEQSKAQVEAVKSIVKGKEGLKFQDEWGDTIGGKVPKSLDQLSQSIVQRKLDAFESYNQKQIEVGEVGIEIPLDTSIQALRDFADSAPIRTQTPGAAAYAEKLAGRLEEQGSYTPADAQAAMKILNQSVETYKKNPTAENASRAGADAIQANFLRKRLNGIVEENAGSGPGYTELRREFGAVKSIEKAVNNRLRKFNQESGTSTLNFYDVFSANDLIQGVLTGNPVIAAKGTGLAYIGRKIKQLRDPNRSVRIMFERADRIIGKLEALVSKEEAGKLVAEIEPLLAAEQSQNKLQPDLNKPTFSRNGLVLDMSEPQAPTIPQPIPEVASNYNKLFQIAQSPEGKRLLLERLGREERHAKLMDEILQIPDQLALPPGQGFSLIPEAQVKTFTALGGKHIPTPGRNGLLGGGLGRSGRQKLNALNRGLTPGNR